MGTDEYYIIIMTVLGELDEIAPQGLEIFEVGQEVCFRVKDCQYMDDTGAAIVVNLDREFCPRDYPVRVSLHCY